MFMYVNLIIYSMFCATERLLYVICQYSYPEDICRCKRRVSSALPDNALICSVSSKFHIFTASKKSLKNRQPRN